MSLLDDGPDVAHVYPVTQSTDGDGNPAYAPGAPVTIQCRVQPVDSSKQAVEGMRMATVYKLIARSWPGNGPWDRVEWNGRSWDLEGEPMHSRGSETTRHVTVLLRARDG